MSRQQGFNLRQVEFVRKQRFIICRQTMQMTVSFTLLTFCVQQKAAWYLRRHKQELKLLLIGSKIMGAEFTEGVSYATKAWSSL